MTFVLFSCVLISHCQNQQSANAQSSATADLGSLTFTNAYGRTFSGAELTRQLTELNAAVQRTLPMLQAITQSFSNITAEPSGGLLGGILGGILNRGEGSQRIESSEERQGSSTQLSNLVGVIENVLGTNNPTAQATNETPESTLRHLAVLQAQLQPVDATLQKLALPSTNQTQAEEASEEEEQIEEGWSRKKPLEPTGRD